MVGLEDIRVPAHLQTGPTQNARGARTEQSWLRISPIPTGMPQFRPLFRVARYPIPKALARLFDQPVAKIARGPDDCGGSSKGQAEGGLRTITLNHARKAKPTRKPRKLKTVPTMRLDELAILQGARLHVRFWIGFE